MSNEGFRSRKIYKVVGWAVGRPYGKVLHPNLREASGQLPHILIYPDTTYWWSYWCSTRIWELVACSFTCWSLKSTAIAGGYHACGIIPPGLSSAKLLPCIYLHWDESLGCTSEILIVSILPPAHLRGKDKQISKMKRQVGIFCSYIENS